MNFFRFFYVFIFIFLWLPSLTLAATGDVQISSAEISADGTSVNVSVSYIVTTDDIPAGGSSYNTGGCYKECWAPVRVSYGSCNSRYYAYFKRNSPLKGTFDGSADVESVWCPGGYDDLGVLKTQSDKLTIPGTVSGDQIVTVQYYLQDIAGYGCQKYYGQIYSCTVTSAHPDYTSIFASANLTVKTCSDGTHFCCIDVDNDGYFAVSDSCNVGVDCDDMDPSIKPPDTRGCFIDKTDFPIDPCLRK